MDTQESIVKVGKEKEVSVGNAAMTMAIGIIVERVSRLSQDDQNDLYELVKGLREAKEPEDVEAIRVAMGEILDQEPCGLQVSSLLQQTGRPEKLQRWVDFIAEKVQKVRKETGLTQIELAAKSGLPQSHISRIESAKLSPSQATLTKIAHALGKQLSDLDPSA
jgi:ribosome-binding protein aMBF1 (putative translation factor)